MRVVLDTNVLARAAPNVRACAELLLRCCEDPHVFLLSEFIISEVSRVLRYPRMRKVHGLSDEDIEQYLGYLRSGCVVVALPAEPPPAVVASDPQDDPIVATAVAGRASVLCSLDRHLYQPGVVAYCGAHGIEVMGDIDLMRRLQTSSE